MFKRLKKKGFTLVELLAVIVVLAIIALIGYTIVGDVISGAQESADKENVREYARSVRLAITSAQMNGQTIPSPLDNSWLSTNVEKTGNEVVCNSVTDNNGTITLSGCSVGGSTQKYCYNGTDVTTCTRANNNIVKIYGTDDETFYTNKKTANLFDQAIGEDKIETNTNSSISPNTNPRNFKEGVWYKGLTLNNYFNSGNIGNSYTLNSLATTFTTANKPYGFAQAFKVNAGDTYIFDGDIPSADQVVGFGFYGSNGYPVSYSSANTNTYIYWNSSTKKVEIPVDCYWMTVTFTGLSSQETTYSNVQLVKGDTLPEFEPFGYKISITATKEDEPETDIIVYIGGDKLGANDYLSYDGSNWKVVRNGVSTDPVKVLIGSSGTDAMPTGKVTYSVDGLDDSNIVYNYE